MKFYDHPSTHGHHVNPYACGRRNHRGCTGFSGDYDTYVCGCCCHDAVEALTEEQRVIVQRVRSEATS